MKIGFLFGTVLGGADLPTLGADGPACTGHSRLPKCKALVG
jgi:hypothetical protein